MMKFFHAVWKDPVWSKVIAALILAMLGLIWNQLNPKSFSRLFSVPLWAICCVIIVFFVSAAMVMIEKRKNKELIESISASHSNPDAIAGPPPITSHDDIAAIIDSWWPQAKGYFPENVSANFLEIEKNFNIQRGLVSLIIDKVAYRRYFKVKFKGENFATFEYDHDRPETRL